MDNIRELEQLEAMLISSLQIVQGLLSSARLDYATSRSTGNKYIFANPVQKDFVVGAVDTPIVTK